MGFRVTATDIDDSTILDHLRANVTRNQPLFRRGAINIQPLDLLQPDLNSPAPVEQLADRYDLIIAGDLIYDNDLTEAFVGFLRRLFARGGGVEVLVALEKRYIFSLAELEVAAPAYLHLLQHLRQLEDTVRVDFLEAGAVRQFFCYERGNDMVLIKLAAAARGKSVNMNEAVHDLNS